MKKFSEENISKSLIRAMNNITPNNFNEIETSLKKKEVKMKKKFLWKFIPTTVLATAILLFVGIYYSNNYITESLIGIDVNPSIEIAVNRNDKILKVNALNEGGKKIIDDMDLKNVNLNVALNALIGSMVKYGYLTVDDANILISVQNDDKDESSKMKEVVVNIINDSLNDSKISATILNQTISSNDPEVEKISKDNNISYGKALFIEELVKKDSSLDYTTLAGMSLREIAALVDSKQIDISDIVEYDDDSTIEKIDDAIEDINEEKQIESNNDNLISKDDAKKIVYNHASVNINDVEKSSITLEYDDGIAKYNIEFRTVNKKYEYEINASNGQVLDFETETIKSVTSPSTNYIGETKAKSIAFNHAGIDIDDATLIKIVLDNENGVKVYEIEFTSGQYEFNYEINAITGDILDFEKEID